MREQTCIIIGGGYAGLNAAHAMSSSMKGMKDSSLHIFLIDQQAHHLRKVLLFKPTATDSTITVPWSDVLPSRVTFIQGSVTSIQGANKHVLYEGRDGQLHRISYDFLIVALGSTIRKQAEEQGGIALTHEHAALQIQQQWRSNIQKAAGIQDQLERKRLMSVAVVGAGISGIETAAELAYAMRMEAIELGLAANDVRVSLINAQERLFTEGPLKVAAKLEAALNELGVAVIHHSRASHVRDGMLHFVGRDPLPVGVCIWTLGLQPNPVLRSLGLPVTEEGRVIVDASYRVPGFPGVYSIGDCAHIVDPKNGSPDRMTCKEAIPQANRLAKIIAADIAHRPAPLHQSYMELFCIGLGPESGLVWCRQWGIDFVLTGKLGWKIRKFTWDSASLIK
ncbi:NAD(P)/FAD-dependent oxidoreductase [Paenibacillus alvei]|uniref:NAD(P)/FAD-dependent oxidoreductase n=1 Tax=Paenibacillus alvei TaxID=44250 RepID=UPI002282EE2B|nr:FAD-dependent oxidoreductase [Paenibacillus alvei]